MGEGISGASLRKFAVHILGILGSLARWTTDYPIRSFLTWHEYRRHGKDYGLGTVFELRMHALQWLFIGGNCVCPRATIRTFLRKLSKVVKEGALFAS